MSRTNSLMFLSNDLSRIFLKKSQDLGTMSPGLDESLVCFSQVLREMLRSKVLGPQGGEQGVEEGGDVGHESSCHHNFFRS